jgi:menaquinone-dependent protoporphyrinogen oxidase
MREAVKMRVLIAYTSRYGATQGIAERIAVVLHREGMEAVVQPAQHADDPVGYDAVVIGSAAYFFHWMKHSSQFVRSHSNVLAKRPVWLFSSGPLGSKANDAQGQDLRVVTTPKEIAEFRNTIGPKDHRVFFGALNPEKLSFTHSLVLKLPVNRDNAIFPLGDFRDWNEIEGWATAIAKELKASVGSSTLSHSGAIPG